jgi:hypothetical protein
LVVERDDEPGEDAELETFLDVQLTGPGQQVGIREVGCSSLALSPSAG